MNFFKEKKVEVLLAATLILGFVLRLINVYTKRLLGDPPHFAIEAINFFDSGLLVIWDQSTYLWYAFTNIFFKIFGITQFATRFSSLLFGTLCILAFYLFVFQFSKNKKLALLSTIIFSFAPGIILQTADEHDISVLFFIIMSFYALIYSLQNNSKNYLYISAVIFGVAAMWKAYLAVLLLPYVGFYIYYNYKNSKLTKESFKKLAIVAGIIVLLVSPVFVYNYSNYKHNGVVDFLFATAFPALSNEKTQALYGWTAGNEINKQESKIYRTFVDLFPEDPARNHSALYYGVTQSILSNGPVIWTLALLGFLFMFFKRKDDSLAKEYLVFFSLYFFIPFLYMIEGNFLNKHYLHFLTFAIPLVSYLIFGISSSLSAKFPKLNKLIESPYVYILFLLYFLLISFGILSTVTELRGSFYSENPQNDLIKYKVDNIEKNSLIIYDDRIYNSEAGWLFSDRNYIPVSLLTRFMEYNNNSTQKTLVPIYIVECAVDDCGWGTVSKNAQLNNSMEGFFDSIKEQNTSKVLTVKGKVEGVKYYNPIITGKMEGVDYFIVYKTQMQIDLNLAHQIKMQYEYFLLPTEYLNKESQTYKMFTYTPEGFLESGLNDLAWAVFYINIVLSFLVILFLLYELYLNL